MRNMIKERSLIGLAVVAVLAACGGGGGGGSSTTPSSPTQLEAPTQWSITIPNATGSSSSSRRAQYVDPNTKSITLTLLQNNGVSVTSAPQGPYNLSAGQPGCVTVTNGVTCTFSVNAPIGTDVFTATTYSQLNGVSPLGSGAVALSVVQNTTNTASLTLFGPIQSILAVSNNSANSDTLWNGNGAFYPITYTQAQAFYNQYYSSNARRGAQAGVTAPITSERLYLIASDINGNTILNPTTYNQPITLTLNFLNFQGYGAPNNVTLSDTPPSGLGTASSTSTSGGTVQVYSPADVVTLTLNPSVFSPILPFVYVGGGNYLAANFVEVSTSLASPPPNFVPQNFYLTAENEPTPTPTPSPTPSPTPTPTPPPPTPTPTPTPTPVPTGNISVEPQ